MLDDRGGFDRLGHDLLWLLPLWASSSFGARPRRCLWLLESANGLFVSSDVGHVSFISIKFTDFIAEQKSLQFLTCELRLPVRGLTRIGPAPVTAVKEGRIDLVYDTACVIAEVNAEKCYWVESEVGEERLVKVDQNSPSAVRMIKISRKGSTVKPP
ncbi:hypothetical protein M514_28054 [Trichuris suis]|uniref:Uncharacterized protein n=1 Tax=Trichuris suis TaxID=68888 RepID=A0A085MRC2_9BILA|nr:hypothetical protein M514_28054 [Trichuris suis]